MLPRAPAGVVQRLIADGVTAGTQAAAERKVFTAMFADLVGYTALTERLEPAALAGVLNGYFQLISDASPSTAGTSPPSSATASWSTSARSNPIPGSATTPSGGDSPCVPRSREYNAELGAIGVTPLAIGVGIHRGPGLAAWSAPASGTEYAFVGPT